MYILVHYGEIGTKGKNRSYFEKKLADNIRSFLPKECVEEVKRLYGRLLIKPSDKASIDGIKEELKKIFGIEYFSVVRQCDMNLEKIKALAGKIAQENPKRSIRVSTKRSDKTFPYNSQQLNEILGEFLVKKHQMKVDLENPEINIFVELVDKNAFLYTEKIRGLSGLPVGVTGKLVSLISGGIDSPVAAWKMFGRGCSIVFAHFQNKTLIKGSGDKVASLVKILGQYQFKTKLYIVDFEKLQKEIIKAIPSKYRMIVYRRIMFKIAEKIADKEKALGFVTGDNLAQVASQTLENIKVIYEAAKLPVFAPLIGENKKDIIKLAQEIGTYESSILPYPDCCSFLVAEHPETKSKIEDIKRMEGHLKTEPLIHEALENAKIEEYIMQR